MKQFLIILTIFCTSNCYLQPQSKSLSHPRIYKLDIENSEHCYQSSEIFQENTFTLLFVVNPVCIGCNYNLTIWSRLVKESNLKAYGITINRKQADLYNQSQIIPFEVFTPINISEFNNYFSDKKNEQITLLTFGNRIVFQKTGILTVREYMKIKKQIRKEL